MSRRKAEEWISSLLAPTVAVVASDELEEFARANEIPSFADFLRPFGSKIEGKIHVRDAQGQSVSLDGYSLRFASLKDLQQFEPGVLKRVLLETVSNQTARSYLDVEPSDQISEEEYKERIAKASFNELSPWFTKYRNYICRYSSISDHESFSHPVAYLMAVSTAHPNPIQAFTQLTPTTATLPQFFEHNYLDPDINLKHYLLVHNPELAPSVDADTLFVHMKKTFGLSCHLVTINSPRGLNDDTHSPDLWRDLLQEICPLYDARDQPELPAEASSPRPSTASLTLPAIDAELPSVAAFVKQEQARQNEFAPPKVIPPLNGLLLDFEIRAFHTFVKDMLVQSILPYMERKVQHWNEQVASSRRGLTGRFLTASRRYFGAPAKPAAPVGGGYSSLFPHSSPEFIMRKLGDYAFMLRDYKFAHSTYDAVKKDFQGNEKATKYLAGTQEMLALCVLMSEGAVRGNLDALLDSAITSYIESGSSIHAARSLLFVYEILKQKGQFSEAPIVLMRMIADDSDLRSALLLEQSALCFAKTEAFMGRKFAFFMVMAGHRFNRCNQKEHALRCYMAALKVYEGRGWTLIEDNVYFSLGRLTFQLGDIKSSFQYFMKLLRSSRQPPTQQSAYLREFCHIFKELATQCTPSELANLNPAPIPLMDTSKIRVSLLESENPVQVNQDDELWDTMENDLIEGGFNQTEAGKRVMRQMKFGKDSGKTVCAVGEPVFVTIQFENPLFVSLELVDVYLIAEYSEVSSASSVPAVNSIRTNQMSFDHVDVEFVPSLLLGPQEKRKLQFRVFPKFEGEVVIKGLQYMLCNAVPTFRPLQKKGRRLNETQQQRSASTYAADNSLILSVTPPMPMLDIVFHSFPDTLLSGQVVKAVLEVNNKGNRGLQNLILKLSHPSFFTVGTPEMIDTLTYAQEAPGMASGGYKLRNMLSNTSVINISLPSAQDNGCGVLAAGQTTLIPVWIRGDRIGKHLFRFLFGYQSEGEEHATKYRKLQYSLNVQVQPSLRINAFTRPSSSILKEFILGIEIENLQSTSNVKLLQVSSLSPVWSIAPSTISDFEDKEMVLPGKQTLFVYFRFQHSVSAPSYGPQTSPEALTTKALSYLITGEEFAFAPEDITMQVSSLTMSSEKVDCVADPFQSLTLHSRVQWRTQSLAAQYPGVPAEKLRDLFTLYFTDDADIALLWQAPPLKAGDPPRVGHHYIIGINLGIQAPLQLSTRIGRNLGALSGGGRSLYAATVRERKAFIENLLKPRQKDVSPVRLILQSVPALKHDFTEGFLRVSIKALLRNTSWDSSVKYSLELLSTDLKGSSRDDAMTDFTWTSATNNTGALQPEEEAELELAACFYRCGTYDINKWRLSVTVYLPEIDSTSVLLKSSPNGKAPTGTTYIQMPNLPQYIVIQERE